MTAHLHPTAAGRIARGLEPLPAVALLAPETEEHLTAAGLRPGRMSYFAGRAAPLGAVPAAVVAATFYSFDPGLVARHIPAAWSLAAPATVVVARLAAVDAALHRLLGRDVLASAEVVEAAALARRAAEAVTPQGRALAAAHLALPWPRAPHLVLWQALTVLREHRGDGHVALLLTAGLTGLEALITATAAGTGLRVPFAKASRGWADPDWDGAVAGLRERGLVGIEGLALTPAGRALRQALEDDTDRLGAAPWNHLGRTGAYRLGELGDAIVGALLAAGLVPAGVYAGRGPGVDERG